MISLLLLALCPPLLAQQPQACLDMGACYTGSTLVTEAGLEYGSFQGVRYARPPLAELRSALQNIWRLSS